MKKSILVLLILATGGVLLFLNANTIFESILSKNLARQIGPVRISVARLDFLPHRLLLSGIKIIQDKNLDIKIKNIVLDYDIFKREITKISLYDSYAKLNISRQKIEELAKSKSESQPQGFLKIRTLEVSGLDLELKMYDLRLNANVWASIDVEKGMPLDYFLSITELERQGFFLKEGFFQMRANKAEGIFRIKESGSGGLVVRDVKGKSELRGGSVFFKNIEGEVLNGKMSGRIDFGVQEKTYSFDLSLFNISLGALAESFNFEQKLGISGALSGNIHILVKDTDLLDIKGDLAAPLPGGIFVIKDQKFVKTIAANSNQSLQLVSDSFKDYRYSEGLLKLYLQDGNLIIKADLDGEKGRRDFLITYYAFDSRDLLGLFDLQKHLN
jgi:hypothetical protein